MKKKKIIFLFILISPFLLVFFSNFLIEKTAKNKTFVDSKKIPKNKVGVVLGTSKILKNGSINLYFKYRINAAVELYKKNKVDFILISGDNGNNNYDEPTDFKNELIKRGLPANKIFLDYAGFRTLDSMIRAKEVFGQNSITIISQEFHNQRAIYLAENYGIKAIGFNAKDLSGRYALKTQVREYFARVKAVLDIILKVKPKFLGKKIIIQ